MTIFDVATYCLAYATNKGKPLSNIQLQKALYSINGEYHRKHKRFLFDAIFHAYPYGPVNEELYKKYRNNGALPILSENKVPSLSKIYDIGIINNVLDQRLAMTAFDLVEETRKEHGAWYKTFTEKGDFAEIPKDLIKADFI